MIARLRTRLTALPPVPAALALLGRFAVGAAFGVFAH